MDKHVVAKGTIYLMATQLVILLSGYLLHIFLAHMVSAVVYGNIGIILSIIMITKTLFLTGTTKAISKYVSEQKESFHAVLRSGFRLQLLSIFLCVTLYFIFAGFLAEKLHDPSLTWPIRLSSLVILSVGIYVVYGDGYLNGIRNFKLQALAEMIHSVVRFLLAVALVYFGFNLYGVVFAYFIAPFLALLFVRKAIFLEKSSASFSMMKLLKFSLPITVYYGALLLAMDAGLFLIKNQLDNIALPGYYTAAGTLAKIAFSLLSALPLTLLPSVSKAVADDDLLLVKKYVIASLRYSLMLLIPLTILVYGYAERVLSLFYPHEFIVAGNALRLLIIGYGFFALFFLLSSVLSGAGHHVFAMIIALASLLVSFVSGLILIPIYGLEGAALSTLFAGLAGFLASIIGTFYLFKNFEKTIPWQSFLRILLAAVPLFFLIRILAADGMEFLLYSALLLALYILSLFFMGEFDADDRRLFCFWKKD
ncbi:MAG: oligosaccharide flippase family protein [Nanoarchaeota archaeon]|mgnify:CR=1 FL=1